MAVTIPEVVQPLLEAYTALMDRELPGLMTAFYIHGSIALGAFNPRSSDIDAIAVISRRCTPTDMERLAEIHQTIQQKYPRWSLEVSYLQWSDLGQLGDAVEPHPHSHDGTLSPSGRFEVNSVTWWLLKNKGVTLRGPDPTRLNFSVDWDMLVASMIQNLNTYWRSFTRKPQRIAWLLTDFGIQWAVLGVLRQFYTFREHSITSKDGAGLYALDHVPGRWHRLIREALNIRSQSHHSLYRFRAIRAFEALRFLNFVIYSCNRLNRGTAP